MKTGSNKTVQKPALAILCLGLFGIIGCSKATNAVKVPARLCVANPFAASKTQTNTPQALGIVNGVVAGNTDPLEKTVVGIIMRYELSDGKLSGGTCTGVVAGKDVVISAAHCFKKPPNAVTSQVFITFKSELTNLTTDDVISAVRVLRHPNYTGDTANYSNADIAVLKLSRPVPSSQLVASFVKEPTTLLPGTSVTAIGYGVTGSTNKDSGLKRRADSAVSNLINAANYPASLLRDQIRVVDSTGTSRGACYGDSGGPGFVSGKAHVFGVVQGVHSSVQGPMPNCEKADFNYTLVAPFMPWIEEQIGYKLNVSGEPLTVAEAPAWQGPNVTDASAGNPNGPPGSTTTPNSPDTGEETNSAAGSRTVATSSKRNSANQAVYPYCN